jgi:hypothetical protein
MPLAGFEPTIQMFVEAREIAAIVMGMELVKAYNYVSASNVTLLHTNGESLFNASYVINSFCNERLVRRKLLGHQPVK